MSKDFLGSLFCLLEYTIMRLACQRDIPELVTVYTDALEHAKAVGHIDWPDPYKDTDVQKLIASNELHCFGAAEIEAAAKIAEHADSRIWQTTDSAALYLARVATTETVRGKRYFELQMLPEIMAMNQSRRLRLDCLADNPRLIEFYLATGFTSVGNASFYSAKKRCDVTVARFELDY